MQKQAHIFKRGQQYHWRRRMRRQGVGFFDLKLSLRTTDPKIAAILGRKLSSESDTIMSHAVHNIIPEETARRWMSAIIEREQHKLAHLENLRITSSRDPEDDLVANAIFQAAWAHIARHGVHANISPDMPQRLQNCIELQLRALDNEGHRLTIERQFREDTDHDPETTREIFAMMNLYIQAKADAWAMANTGSYNFIPPDDGPHANGNSAPTLPAAKPEPKPEPEEDAFPDPALTAVVERMNALKRGEGVEEKTLRQYVSFVALFTTLTGVSDVRKIRQSHASAFRSDLHKLPKSWGKSPRDAIATRDEIMARAAALPPEKAGLSVGTINRHLEHLAQIVSWASDEGIPVDDKLNPAKLRRKDTVRDRDRREALTHADLQKISEHKTWSRPSVRRNGSYWAPLIAAYTGARRAEIAGLMVTDVVEVDGVPCLSIANNNLRRIKNLASKRVIPIHSHLIELGFLTHVEDIKKRGNKALFPEQEEPGTGIWGRKLGRTMRGVINKQLGESGGGLSFHSYRHYVQNALDHNGIDDKIVRDIIGHEGRDVHERTYRKQTPIAEMQAAIETLPRVL
ncbi:tyrosine-type recombinase/integrase [Sagittula sp. SSi028]|uniref:tyrosine-type recombinase/integrase n=1 Tax=Sagittula sp. SSi028 TaxID=3400636 RepID=UPI003AF8ACCE